MTKEQKDLLTELVRKRRINRNNILSIYYSKNRELRVKQDKEKNMFFKEKNTILKEVNLCNEILLSFKGGK